MLTHLIISTVFMVLLLGYYVFQLRTKSWFQFNRFYLLGLIPLACWLPTLQLSFAMNLPFTNTQDLIETYLPIVEITDTPTGSGGHGILVSLWIVYLGGVLVCAIRKGLDLYSLFRFTKEFPLQQKNPFYRLFYTGGSIPTSSFMGNIFWDETAELLPEEEAQVMAHETAHIRFRHSWDILFVEILKVVLWFHPIVYPIGRELTILHEFQADKAALGNKNKVSYAHLILKKEYSTSIRLGHTFFESPALARIKMLGQRSSISSLLLSYIPLMPLLLGLTIMGSSGNIENPISLSAPGNVSFDQSSDSNEKTIPDISALISVDEEPVPLNMADIQRTIGYPVTAREEGMQGTVVLRVLVDEGGNYLDHSVITQISPLLTEPVEREIANIKFTPAIVEGVPVKFWVNIPFRFRLLN